MAKYLIIIKNENDPNLDETIEIDCTLSIDHNQTSKVSEHPTEEGFKVTDHVIEESIHITLEGIISDATKEHSIQEPYRIFDKFRDLLKSRKKCTIVSTRMNYENMICTSFSERKQGGQPTEALFFNLAFTEIRTAKTKISKVNKQKLEVKKLNDNKEQTKQKVQNTQDRFQNKTNKSKSTPKPATEKVLKKHTATKKDLSNPNSGKSAAAAFYDYVFKR